MSPEVVNNLMSHFKTPAKRERNPLQAYEDAVTQLDNAIYEIDQAHATLKDIGCEHYSYSSAMRANRRSIRQIHDDAVALLASISELDCDSCGRPVRVHKLGECEEWS